MEIAQGINGVLPETGGHKNTETLREMLQLEINEEILAGRGLFTKKFFLEASASFFAARRS